MRRAGASKTMASKHLVFLPRQPHVSARGDENQNGAKACDADMPEQFLSTSTSVLFPFTQQEEYAAASDMLRTVSVDKTRAKRKEKKKSQTLVALTPCNDRSDSLSLYSNAHPMRLLAPCSLLHAQNIKLRKCQWGYLN